MFWRWLRPSANMRKASREREDNVPSSSCSHGCVDVKSLLLAILLVATLFLACEILLKYIYIKPSCSLNHEDNPIRSSSFGHHQEKLALIRASNAQISESRATLAGGNHMEGLKKHRVEKERHVIGQEVQVKMDNLSVIKRDFEAFGSAASVFVELGAYRGGDNSFAIVGLGSKPLHVYGEAGFTCEWEPARTRSALPDVIAPPRVKGQALKFLPDWGYGRVYTVVVINCTFEHGVGLDGQGGKLIVHATSARDDVVTFTALEETSQSYATTSAQYKNKDNYTFDYLYCGSSLFGDINPQRMREWLAYHVKLMGPKSHFVFHDTGGVSAPVRQVLLRWQALGHVTLHDIREQAKFDGYYYNQFLIVNDCLHRTRFLAKWTFFFDVDEYLYVPIHTTLHDTMLSFSNYTQITFEQTPMSPKLCEASHDNSSRGTLWGIEKLVYRSIKRRSRRLDRKYAIQARDVFATGVHMSENLIGKTLHTKGSRIKYYHYHNSITTKEGSLCKEYVNSTSIGSITYYDQEPFKIDMGIQYFAQAVKDFELQKIGPSLNNFLSSNLDSNFV